MESVKLSETRTARNLQLYKCGEGDTFHTSSNSEAINDDMHGQGLANSCAKHVMNEAKHMD